MKALYFHVGSERCGSTFVQSFFNAPEVLKALTRFSIRFDVEIYYALGKLLPVPRLDEARLAVIQDRFFTPHKKCRLQCRLHDPGINVQTSPRIWEPNPL